MTHPPNELAYLLEIREGCILRFERVPGLESAVKDGIPIARLPASKQMRKWSAQLFGPQWRYINLTKTTT
jgi:hypothetical protein